MTLDPIDFSNMRGSKVNVEKGHSLLKRLSEADLTQTMELFKADGSIDGAFYLLYKGLAKGGLISNIQVEEEKVNETVQMTLSILKYIMYNCFVIGAEAFKSVKTVEDLWDLPESIEPKRKDSNE